MFTTEPSMNAMLDPTMAAASVSHLRVWDRPASKVDVARMTPDSQGGAMNPTIGRSRMAAIAVTVRLAHTIGNCQSLDGPRTWGAIHRPQAIRRVMAFRGDRPWRLGRVSSEPRFETLFKTRSRCLIQRRRSHRDRRVPDRFAKCHFDI